MKKLLLVALATVSTAFLVACGGGGGGGTAIAVQDAQVPINAANGPAVVSALADETFTFPAGVPEFGTNTTTTLTFDDPAANTTDPRFTITSGGRSASGTMSFGSCRFRITRSDFASGPLRVNNTIVIENCTLELDVSGTPVDGEKRTVTAILTLNGTDSNGTAVVVTITYDGYVTVNGTLVGRVDVEVLTGGG